MNKEPSYSNEVKRVVTMLNKIYFKFFQHNTFNVVHTHSTQYYLPKKGRENAIHCCYVKWNVRQN